MHKRRSHTLAEDKLTIVLQLPEPQGILILLSGNANANAEENVALGYKALFTQNYNPGSAWSSYNVAIGNYSLFNLQSNSTTNGIRNSAIGHKAGYSVTLGSDNVFQGYEAGYSNTIGKFNTFNGFQAGNGNTGANNNVAIGYKALFTQNFMPVTGGTWESYNVAIGNNALYSNLSTSETNGYRNTALGHNSGYSNTIGSDNVFHGYQAGYSNTTGNGNTFSGFEAGYTNSTASQNTFYGYKAGRATSTTDGYGNVFMGYIAGQANTTGSRNTFMGYASGQANTTGNYNVAIGGGAGYTNTTNHYGTFVGFEAGKTSAANYNTMLGFQAGELTSSGANNVAVGANAGYTITTGNSNTFLGYGADANAGTYSNSTAIGNAPPLIANSNYVHIGNTSVSWIGGQVNWLTYSDARIKNNVQANVPGLSFIKLLRPVTFNFDIHIENSFLRGSADTVDWIGKYDIEQTRFSGFIAQEVDSAAQKVGYDFSGVNKSGPLMTLSYSEFVVPLVKAIQELSTAVDSLKATPNAKKAIQNNNNLEERVAQLEVLLNQCCVAKQSGDNTGEGNLMTNTHQIELANSAILFQNIPNPFGDGTTIKYFVPENSSAQIIFYDDFGKELKSFIIKEKGMGQLNITAKDLAIGMYSYSLHINGKVVDTKKMIKNN